MNHSTDTDATNRHAVGIVTRYHEGIGVAIVLVARGTLKTGDPIHIQGHATDVRQGIVSMQSEHLPIERAEAGQVIGIVVDSPVREHDIVYRLR